MARRRGRPADGSGPGDEPAEVPDPGGEPGPPDLSSRHRRTLEAIFERPTRPDIPWRDVEALFVALGGEITEGRGSRRRVALRGVRAVFHEPHPEKVTDRGAVKGVRDFLERAGIRP
jgi:hypothetical protein